MTESGTADIGLIGLAVMGQNLVLNIESRGFTVAVHNRTAEVTRKFVAERCAGRRIIPAWSPAEFAASLRKPRKVVLMVKAGKPVDAVLEGLLPHLEPGDIVMDGGNSHFPDTGRRQESLRAAGLKFIGMGVSGGEYGALHGPSIMPGGEREAWEGVKDILLKAAAVTADGSCCAWVGKGSAGHFTKMVHNGIEYAVMQMIAEIYDLMTTGLRMKPAAVRRTFEKWNRGKLESYLIEITGRVLAKSDPETGRPLVDMILDRAEQKGTGKWTSQAALDLGVPVPAITAAVDARIVSGHKDERGRMAPLLSGRSAAAVRPRLGSGSLERALHSAALIAYAQGFHLLSRASAEFKYGIEMAEVARIWKGGCIIRARMLDSLRAAFLKEPSLSHLFLSRTFVTALRSGVRELRTTVGEAVRARLPVPALAAALSYHESFARSRLPANLTQAQRDYFGAHTFERTDRKGVFHADWEG